MLVLALALSSPTSDAAIKPDLLPSVVVRAEAASPRIWRFERGNKIVWVLGTAGPLSKDLVVDWTQVERRIAQSQVVLGSTGLVVGDNIGFLRAATLWPAIRRVQFNRDDRTLQQMLSPELHRRWESAAVRHGAGRDERKRPMYAAFDLYRAAADATGVGDGPNVNAMVAQFAKRARVEVVDARARLPIADAKKAVRAFDVAHDDDVGCLAETLDRLDPWLDNAQARSDAWRMGDAQAFEVANARARMSWCWSTLTNTAVARGQGIADLDGFVADAWVAKLRQVVQAHDVVFATLPMGELIDGSGLSAALMRDGFVVASADETAAP